MFESVRGWFNRNRTRLAVSAGVAGGLYVAGHYALGKLTEARQRISDDRIARENLKRRFAQNQEDCTYTVLALLPTATDNILRELPVESITQELQARKTDKLARSTASSEIAPSDVASTADIDASVTSSGFVKASQLVSSQTEDDTTATEPASTKPPKPKMQLWNDLKILSITRAFTMIYTLALLTLLTRIQLNLLGRRNYLSSVVSLASPPAQSQGISLEDRDEEDEQGEYGSDFDTNRKYLTFSWWLLHRGWKQLKDRVEAAVTEVFGVLAPRDNVSFSQLSALIFEVRKKLEGKPGEPRSEEWLAFLLPPSSQDETVLQASGVVDAPPANQPMISPSLRRLLDETADLIDSPNFKHVLTLLLDAAFSLLVDDKLAVQAFKISPQAHKNFTSPQDFSDILEGGSSLLPGSSSSRIQELADDGIETLASQTQCKLATILAVMTRSAHVIGSGGSLDSLIASKDSDSAFPSAAAQAPSLREANEYLAEMESVRDLEAFAAVVYSSNFEFESMEAEAERRTNATRASSSSTLVLQDNTTSQESMQLQQSSTLRESFVDVAASSEKSLEAAWSKASSS